MIYLYAVKYFSNQNSNYSLRWTKNFTHLMDKVPPTYVNLTVVWGFYLFEWWGRTLQTWFNESAENSITLCKSQILLWKNNLITPYSSWGCDKHRQFQVYNHAVWMWHITATDHIHILRLVSIIQTQLKRGEIVWVCAWGNSHVINYKKDNILFQFSSTHLRTNRFAWRPVSRAIT